jgi:hypothetical protein
MSLSAAAQSKLASVAAALQPTKAAIFQEWKDWGSSAKRQRALAAAASVRALADSVAWAFRTWAANAHDSHVQRELIERFAASQKQKQLCKVLYAWRGITRQVWAARRAAQERLQHTSVSVRPVWLAGAAFDAWAMHVREERARREADGGVLAEYFLAWRVLTRSIAGCRRRLRALHLRQRRRVLSAAFETWAQATSAAKHEVRLTYRAQAHLLRRTLSTSFALWHTSVAEELAERAHSAAAARVISKGFARRTFRAWAQHTAAQRLAQVFALRLQQRLAFQAMRASFVRWKGAAIVGRQSRATATCIRHRGDRQLLRHALHTWECLVRRQSDARVTAERMFGKHQRAWLRRAWLAWRCAHDCTRAVEPALELQKKQWGKRRARAVLQAWRGLAQGTRTAAEAAQRHQFNNGVLSSGMS